MEKINKTLLELVPIFIGIALNGIFWKESLLLAFVYIIMIIVVVRTSYKKGDYIALGIGFVSGLIIEIMGASIGFQVFTRPDFFGIPFWLPIAWAYAFMFMKRIGVIINE